MPLYQAGLPQPKPSKLTEQDIRDRLTLWRENWLEWLDPRADSGLTRKEIWREIDKCLDLFGDHLKAKAKRAR